MKITHAMVKMTAALILGGLFAGCETGTNNLPANTTQSKATQSGIISKTENYTPYTPKASEITKIFSKKATPGYYVQVGYFKTKTPSSEFLNRMKYAQLPYTIVEKYDNGTPFYHALVGPYKSYNQANAIKVSAKEFVAENAFIVNVVRP